MRTFCARFLAISITLTAIVAGSIAGAPPVLAAAASGVSISGTVRDGGTVRAKIRDDAWAGAAENVSHQWVVNGEPIAQATGSKLTITSTMVGKKLMLRATALVAGVEAVAESAPKTVLPGVTSERSLERKLTALIRDLPGSYAVSIRELDGGKRTVSIRAHADREPASSSKLFIAYAVFAKIDNGSLSYSSRVSSGLTVSQCLRAMIEPSDNYCASELRYKVGTSYLNRLLDRGGYDDTHFWYSRGRTKVTSASDMTTLLSRLERGDLLSEASSKKFLRLLRTQVWREAIPPGLPVGVDQASKPGTLYTRSGMVQTDAAIVYGKKTRYVISVMGNRGATIPSITRISRLTYRHLQGASEKKLFSYSRQQMVATRTIALRSRPGGSAHIVRSYSKGTRVEVIDSTRRWYFVRIAGRTGWTLNTGLKLRNS
jgi:hypothetical protein